MLFENDKRALNAIRQQRKVVAFDGVVIGIQLFGEQADAILRGIEQLDEPGALSAVCISGNNVNHLKLLEIVQRETDGDHNHVHQFGEWEKDENQKTVHNVKFIDNIQIGDKPPGIGFE